MVADRDWHMEVRKAPFSCVAHSQCFESISVQSSVFYPPASVPFCMFRFSSCSSCERFVFALHHVTPCYALPCDTMLQEMFQPQSLASNPA